MTEAETPQKIIAAATTVFSREGFKGARMQQIAKQANVNQALLHYYFNSKENLYEEVLFRFFAKIIEQLAHHFQSPPSPEAALSNFIHAYMDILKDNPELPRLMVSEMLDGGSHIIATADRIFSQTGVTPPDLIAPFIEKTAAEGLIRPVDARQTAISVLGMCIFYFIAKPLLDHVWGEPTDEDNFFEERKAAIMDLVLHGLKIEKEAIS